MSTAHAPDPREARRHAETRQRRGPGAKTALRAPFVDVQAVHFRMSALSAFGRRPWGAVRLLGGGFVRAGCGARLPGSWRWDERAGELAELAGLSPIARRFAMPLGPWLLPTGTGGSARSRGSSARPRPGAGAAAVSFTQAAARVLPTRVACSGPIAARRSVARAVGGGVSVNALSRRSEYMQPAFACGA